QNREALQRSSETRDPVDNGPALIDSSNPKFSHASAELLLLRRAPAAARALTHAYRPATAHERADVAARMHNMWGVRDEVTVGPFDPTFEWSAQQDSRAASEIANRAAASSTNPTSSIAVTTSSKDLKAGLSGI